MAAGGGRGVGTAFGKEGEDLTGDEAVSAGGLTITRLQGQRNRRPDYAASESETDTSSETGSSNASASVDTEDDLVPSGNNTGRGAMAVAAEETWQGGVSCVVGLQKRGLRGLMEGRRMRERERGRAVGGLGSPTAGGFQRADTGIGMGVGANGSMSGVGGGGVGLGCVHRKGVGGLIVAEFCVDI